MELKKCMGCMEPFAGYPCPNCGFDAQNEKKMEYALPLETILAGKYLVGKVLGQGGFGITYIGWDLALERKVAIKEYYPSGQVSRTPGNLELSWYTTESSRQAREDGMQMFLKEARKMSKVDEVSGIVRVRDLFQENGTAYIVMDYVEGETLKARLQRVGPMPWKQAKDIFLPAIRTMEEVHKAGLIHRDISPDNLMLTPDGKVKLLDLGAAKDLTINSGASSMQVAKSGFSPLEQYTQRGGSGPWTDVYAMAATIYYTLTGQLPASAVERVEEDSLNWTLPALQALPGSMVEALQNAMVLSAKKRTQSMAELEKGLLSDKETKGVETRSAHNSEQMPQPRVKQKEKRTAKRKPRKLWIAAAAAVATVLCGMLVWAALRGTLVWTGKTAAPIVAGKGEFTVGICSDGKVKALGRNLYGECDTADWDNIVAVAAGTTHTIGLCDNGTVVATGSNARNQCNK